MKGESDGRLDVLLAARGHGVHGLQPVALYAVDREDDVLMNLLVHRELASLAEGTRAPLVVAFKWLLLCVDVSVLLQVLRESEGLEAENTDVLLDRRVRGDVSPEGEASGVRFVAAGDFAFIWSFHWSCVLLC